MAAAAQVTCPAGTLNYACHLAPWGYQSDDQTYYMQWNMAFALLPLASQWEFTHNVTAAKAALPLFLGCMQWWACYLNKTAGGVYRDNNAHLPDAEHEGQLVADPIIGLSLVSRIAAATMDICLGVGHPIPPSTLDVFMHLTPYPTAQAPPPPSPAPPGSTNFTLYPNARLSGDFRMGGEATLAACEDACGSVPQCAALCFCPNRSVPTCDEGPSCWFYRDNATQHPGPGFTVGVRQAAPQPPPAPRPNNVTLWTAFAGAGVGETDTFGLYPTYPSEARGGFTHLTHPERNISQASSAQYTGSWTSDRRPLDVFVAAVLSLSGQPAGTAPYAFAYSPGAILGGLEAWLGGALGRNQLGYAPGGGVENVGVSRAVTEMLLGSGVLVATEEAVAAGGGAQWYARLFPVWPQPQGSFEGLVAKGGCVFSAALDGSGVGVVASPVAVQAPLDLLPPQAVALSSSSNNCTLLNPWQGSEGGITVTCAGRGVSVVWLQVAEGSALSFLAPAGQSCSVAKQ